ncbi:TRAP transporter small permease [Thioclava sp. FTW29]|uniref:TRAP transporter small permease protein n=1 Tax=Thioclava litoralis TaxID=3076557 RepID=A0ABZ1E6J8_9RHOB|nr:TRAP transporter small permease [Thioclava sp. FTW29]
MEPVSRPLWLQIFDRANLVLVTLAGAFLMVVLGLVFVGVFARYVFNAPILGINEVVQLASAAVVMLALPYCTSYSGHVSVDVLDGVIGAWGRFLGDIVSRVLSSFVLYILCTRAIAKAVDAWDYEDTTNMLGLPLWPFYAIIAAGVALCIVVMALQAIVIMIEKVRA